MLRDYWKRTTMVARVGSYYIFVHMERMETM